MVFMSVVLGFWVTLFLQLNTNDRLPLLAGIICSHTGAACMCYLFIGWRFKNLIKCNF